jgi:hypothetical protein
MLTSGLVLLHDHEYPRVSATTPALPESLNWELFDHSTFSPDLAPNGCNPYLREEIFDELMECATTWLNSQTRAYQNLFPNTSVSIPMVTMRHSL